MTAIATQQEGSAPGPSSPKLSSSFDIVAAYHRHLSSSPSLPHPIAAINALCDLITHSTSSISTVSELISLIQIHSTHLKSSLANPVPARAGTDLFSRFVISMDWREDVVQGGFEGNKERLVQVAREYCDKTVPACRRRICQRSNVFIREGAVILTHSYSRVVMQLLLEAAHFHRNTISVYVTESRPGGLGLKTYQELTAAGIPATLVLDTAVGYVMNRVDAVLVGSEGVAESGGLLNAVGTYQLSLVAKSLGKPFYAAAESYKFLRLFPLSQSDLPTTKPILPLPAATKSTIATSTPTKQNQKASHDSGAKIMTREQEELNPEVDYTPPEYVTAILSDVGVLTPGGVADALLTTFGGD
ncbi:unnamed protein product [Jaminaea pallidilutea]